MGVIVLGIIMREIFVVGKKYNCETNVDKWHNVIMLKRYEGTLLRRFSSHTLK